MNHKQPAASGRIATPFSLPVRDFPVPSVSTVYTYVLPVKASPQSQPSHGPAHKSGTQESGKPLSRCTPPHQSPLCLYLHISLQLWRLQPGQLTLWAPGPSRKSDKVPLQDTPSRCPFSRAPGPHVLLLSRGRLRASPTLLPPAQLLAEPWHLGVIYFCQAVSAACIQAHLSSCFWCFSSRAWAFICCTSMVSGFLRRMYSSWLPMQSCRILLLILSRGA